MTKEPHNSEVKLIFTCTSLSQPNHRRMSRQEPKHGKNLDVGTEAEVIEKCCLLVCSSSLIQFLPYSALAHISRGTIPTVGHSTSINDRENTHTDRTKCQLDKGIFSFLVLPSQMCVLVCVTLNKTEQQVSFLLISCPPAQGHTTHQRPPLSIRKVKTLPQTCLQAKLIEPFSPLRVSIFRWP